MQHAERCDSHLEIAPFWQTRPMQCCQGGGDVVVTTQSLQLTIRSVKNRLKLPLLVCRNSVPEKLVIVESRMHK